MMMNNTEANQLFNQMSKAIESNDHEKLSSLTAVEAPEPVEPELEEQPNPEQPEPVEPEKPEEEVEDTDTPPGEEPAEEPSAPEDKSKEPNEMDTLKEQLEALRKENHSLKSQAGRVPHVQKRLSELDKKLAELTKQSPSSQAATKISPKVDEALKKLQGDDPELAAAIRESLNAAVTGVAEEQHAREVANLQFLREQELSAHEAAEATRLLEMHPNAPDVLKSPHWAEWLSQQSNAMKSLVNDSNSADDLSFAFHRYAADMQRKYPDLAQKAQEAPVAPKTETANKIEEDRAKRMAKTADISGKPAAQTKQPEDPQALFNKYSEQIMKELGYKR